MQTTCATAPPCPDQSGSSADWYEQRDESTHFILCALVVLCLLLASRANAALGDELPSPNQMCHESTALGRDVWRGNFFVAPPDVSALMVDVIDGKLPQVRRRLSEMPSTDAVRWRQSALIIATYAGQSELVDELLNEGAAVNEKGWMPPYRQEFFDHMIGGLDQDPRFGGSHAIKNMRNSGLIENNGESFGSALITATQCDDAPTVKVLLRHHADPATRLDPTGADVLLMAIVDGDTTIVRDLLDHGVDVCAAKPHASTSVA